MAPRDGALVVVLHAFAFSCRFDFLAVISAAGRTGIEPMPLASYLDAHVGPADEGPHTLQYAWPSTGTFRFSVPPGAALSRGFTQVFD